MINAHTAYQQTVETLSFRHECKDELFREIDRQIRVASSDGKYQLLIKLTDEEKKYLDDIVAELTRNDYIIRQNTNNGIELNVIWKLE